MRTHGPLTDTSVFKFESFYGEMRRSFVPGTMSPMKQALQNILMKRAVSHHCCKNSMLVTNYETPLESNQMIYTFERKEYSVYEVSEIDGETLLCYQVGKYPASFPETPEISWSEVGVFKRGGKSSEITNIEMSNICGKVLNVGDFMITCPKNILNEK